jgi:hypothetical protein
MPNTNIDDESRSSSPTAPVNITGEEYVRWAYRLLLGREPESPKAVQNNPFKNNRKRLVQEVLNSAEFRQSPELHRYKALSAASSASPFMSWDTDAIAFIHLPKTGGTTLHSLLSACFPPDRICPQHYNALHFYSPAELATYDFFSGHFDYFALRFIPRHCVRSLSIFRDPDQRLISFYRFCKSHPPIDEFEDEMFIKLANELTVEEFFEHNFVISSCFTNNSYILFFGSSLYDSTMIDALSNGSSTLDTALENYPMAAHALAENDVAGETLARATQRVLSLDAIGLTERFKESVETIFATLGLKVPQSIIPDMVTDELPNSDARFSRVPPVAMTARLSRALVRLTKYDRIIYDVAMREFDRRRFAGLSMERQARVDLPISNGRSNGYR